MGCDLGVILTCDDTTETPIPSQCRRHGVEHVKCSYNPSCPRMGHRPFSRSLTQDLQWQLISLQIFSQELAFSAIGTVRWEEMCSVENDAALLATVPWCTLKDSADERVLSFPGWFFLYEGRRKMDVCWKIHNWWRKFFGCLQFTKSTEKDSYRKFRLLVELTDFTIKTSRDAGTAAVQIRKGAIILNHRAAIKLFILTEISNTTMVMALSNLRRNWVYHLTAILLFFVALYFSYSLVMACKLDSKKD